MTKTAIASWLFMLGAIAVFASDMTKSGYWEFTSAEDIKKIIPNTVPPQFAKILQGDTTGCLTNPAQTKPVSLSQIRTLRQLTDKKEVTSVLGNAFCETAKGWKYFTESGKELNIDRALDYDFSNSSAKWIINGRSATTTMLGRSSAHGTNSQKESGKTR